MRRIRPFAILALIAGIGACAFMNYGASSGRKGCRCGNSYIECSKQCRR